MTTTEVKNKEVIFSSFDQFLDVVKASVRLPDPEALERRNNALQENRFIAVKPVAQPHQVAHIERQLKIWERFPTNIDTSDTGLGKTAVKFIEADRLNLELVVFCPANVIATWEDHAEMFGMNLPYCMSYETLSGANVGVKESKKYVSSYTKIAMNLLYKKIDVINLGGRGKNKKVKENIEYYPTDSLLQLIARGALFVFDEYQKVKNETLGFRAANAIARAIFAMPNCQSRIGLCSASPFENKKMANQTMKLLGVVKKTKMYTNAGGVYNWYDYGIGEIITFLGSIGIDINAEITKQRMAGEPETLNYMNASNALYFPYHVLIILLKGIFISKMKKIKYPPELQPILTNANIPLPPGNRDRLVEVITKIAEAQDRINNIEGMGYIQSNSDLSHWKSVRKINTEEKETLRLPGIYEIAQQILQIPGPKVVICLHYLKNISTIKSMFENGSNYHHLKRYNPLILAGTLNGSQITAATKRANVHAFQNDPEQRIIIFQIQSGAVGISLHDQVGDSPRVLIGSPDYSIQLMFQAQGRINRVGIKSRPIIMWAYGLMIRPNERGELDPIFSESRIQELLDIKGEVLHAILDDKTGVISGSEKIQEDDDANIVLPSDLKPSYFTDLVYQQDGQRVPYDVPYDYPEYRKILQVYERGLEQRVSQKKLQQGGFAGIFGQIPFAPNPVQESALIPGSSGYNYEEQSGNYTVNNQPYAIQTNPYGYGQQQQQQGFRGPPPGFGVPQATGGGFPAFNFQR